MVDTGGGREAGDGFIQGRRVTAAYVAAQGILALLASITAAAVGTLLIVVGAASHMASVAGVFDRGPEEVERYYRSRIVNDSDLWQAVGVSAVTVAGMAGMLMLVSWLRHRGRARAPRLKRLTDERIVGPLPAELRGREVWYTKWETLIERTAILLKAADVHRAMAGPGSGYRYTIWHEWHHAATGDASWAFAGHLSGRIAAVVAAFGVSFVVTFVTPLMWAGAFAPWLIAVFGFTVFFLAYRYAASVLPAFCHVKELLADRFADHASGERATLVYAPAAGRVPAGYLSANAGQPTEMERLSFVRHGRTDRIFILCAGLIANWLILRLMCSAGIAAIGTGGLPMMVAVDLAMAVPVGMLLKIAAAHGAPPRSLVGWGVFLAPVLLLLGVTGPFVLYVLFVLGPATVPVAAADLRLAAVYFPWVAAGLLLFLVIAAVRRRGDVPPLDIGMETGRIGVGAAWTYRVTRLGEQIGKVQSWAALAIGGLTFAYAIIMTSSSLRTPSTFDAASLLVSAAMAFAAYRNLVQFSIHAPRRRVWPLVLEGTGVLLYVVTFLYLSAAIDHIGGVEMPGTSDLTAFARRLEEYTEQIRPFIVVQAAGAMAEAAVVVLALYGLRLLTLRRVPGEKPNVGGGDAAD